jgi:hypothetical protein
MLGADPVLATKNWEPVFNPKLTIERTSEAISIDGSLEPSSEHRKRSVSTARWMTPDGGRQAEPICSWSGIPAI